MKRIISLFCSLILMQISFSQHEISDRELSAITFKRLAFYTCLDHSVGDSLTYKLKDSSGNNLYYHLYGYDPVSNASQRPYIDSLYAFSIKWAEKKYPNLDHPNTQMHVRKCLEFYESKGLNKLVNFIFDNSFNQEDAKISDKKDYFYHKK
ncbi:hypothetical protein EDM00_04385 [Ornithobacterium rhinotracheale]|uniref:hypothetical protein n=1 Tax=Ornithobacterium rhinotracheale TaxID=28251 RepID=UPI00129CC0C0|nr:hypothetical protein [Ornithobacterium rhinotracheale]MRI63232.1 hypothetical protein [Ornithobacterium rhinotracheale]